MHYSKWQKEQFKTYSREQRLEVVVQQLRMKISEWEDVDPSVANKITEAIKRVNQKRSDLGFIGNKHYYPSWLSAYELG